jgi:hypothetical protein
MSEAAMRSTVTRAVIVAALAAGCGASPTVPDQTITQLRAAPTVATIDGARIELQVDVWRDFQPISQPGGKGLRVSARLPATAATFILERIWVLFGDERWDSTPAAIPGSTTWTAGEGPQWGPGVSVDVVAQIRGPSGMVRLVRAADQLIRGTF